MHESHFRFLSLMKESKETKTEKKKKSWRGYLRDSDGQIGSEQLWALPEAVERRNDGARENVFKNLQIHQIDYILVQ